MVFFGAEEFPDYRIENNPIPRRVIEHFQSREFGTSAERFELAELWPDSDFTVGPPRPVRTEIPFLVVVVAAPS